MNTNSITDTSELIFNQLNWRYATKKFNAEKKLSKETIDNLLSFVNLSASSYGLQPYRVLNIESTEMRAKLSAPSYGQSQITEASHLLVFAAVTNLDDAFVDKFINLTAETRNVSAETMNEYSGAIKASIQHRDLAARLSWSARQAYIAMGTLLQSAALLHVDACPMEGFSAELYDTVLGLKEHNLTALAVVTLGHRAEDDSFQHYAKVRIPLDELVIKF